MYYYLYWDESAKQDGSKLFRALYASKEEALAQAEHDMTCGQCDGTGKEDTAWGPQDCRHCEGTGENWSKQLLGIEESSAELGGDTRATIERGQFVWRPGEKKES